MDSAQLYDIWYKYYKDEMSLPDFSKKFLCAFAVTEDDGRIITAGGIRLICEAVLLTDKSLPIRTRRKALLQLIEANKFVAGQCGYNNLNAFVGPGDWQNQLIRGGCVKSEILTFEL